MSHFNFAPEDFESPESVLRGVTTNQVNVFQGQVTDALQTSWSQEETPSKGLTSWSVSDILQGAPLVKSERVVLQTLNQRISGSASSFVSGTIAGGDYAAAVDSNWVTATAPDLLTEQTIANSVGLSAVAGGRGLNSGAQNALGNQVRPNFPPGNVPPGQHPRDIGLPNGAIPEEYMVKLGIPDSLDTPGSIPEHMLWEPAAIAFFDMKAAMDAAGVWGGIQESYRTVEKQQYFYNCMINKNCNNGNLAADPGTSNHGWGMSLDLGTGNGALGWLRANAGTYGYIEDVPGENWHWTFYGG